MAAIVTIASESIQGWSSFRADSRGISAASTPSIVINKNALVAQTHYKDPYRLINGDDATGANVMRLPVPPGAVYAFLALAYVVGSGSHPTLAATCRVAGNFGKYGKAYSDYRVGSLGNGFSSPEENWEPLGNDNTRVYNIVVGDIGEAPMQVNNTHWLSAPTVVHLHGCSEIMAPILTPATGPQYAALIASFRR